MEDYYELPNKPFVILNKILLKKNCMIDNVIKMIRIKTPTLRNLVEICSVTQFPPKYIQINPMNTAVT